MENICINRNKYLHYFDLLVKIYGMIKKYGCKICIFDLKYGMKN